MPVNQVVWQDGEPQISMHDKVLNFLEQHRGEAFHPFEISDQIAGTDILPVDFDAADARYSQLTGKAVADQLKATRITCALDRLVYEEKVTCRSILIKKTDVRVQGSDRIGDFYKIV